MQIDEFRRNGHSLIDWIADYYENIENYPVKSQVAPGEIYDAFEQEAPEEGTTFNQIFGEFEQKILKGITHWQHPSFFAYFNANTSFPSILGELLTSAIASQCMIWETSPAAAELEEKVCDWLRIASDLSDDWTGVIQDTASTATLCALLMAREKHSDFDINRQGFNISYKYTIYCSSEAHSSIEKGVKIAGFGSNHVRKIPVDDQFAMIPDKLEDQIQLDIENGFIPLCVVAAVGTTGSHGIDPVRSIGEICKRHDLFYAVDAAHAGSAAILSEKQWMIDGVELADAYVFNPHKWMFTNFDCTMFYVKDQQALIRTFEILPEYLKTNADKEVNNYRDWGIQLGRRFRALKLWMVIKNFGLQGMREKMRSHIDLAQYFKEALEKNDDFEVLAPVPLNLVCFHFNPSKIRDEQELNDLNAKLENNINASGKAYLTHTKLNGKYTLRVCIGQTNVEKRHVDDLLKLLKQKTDELISQH